MQTSSDSLHPTPRMTDAVGTDYRNQSITAIRRSSECEESFQTLEECGGVFALFGSLIGA
jgi:hypothetical protein